MKVSLRKLNIEKDIMQELNQFNALFYTKKELKNHNIINYTNLKNELKIACQELISKELTVI